MGKMKIITSSSVNMVGMMSGCLIKNEETSLTRALLKA